MNEPLISIIIPIYNASMYLRRCLDSVHNQTYRNLEILLIDDGSTDDSGKIADEYASADKRFKVFHILNGGVSRARNYGLDRFTGEYLTFIDSDDFVHEQYVECLFQAIRQCNVRHAICLPYNSIDGIYNYILRKQKAQKVNVRNEFDYSKVYAYGTVWGGMYHKSLISNTRFSSKYYVGEDEVFFAEILLKSKEVAVLNEYLYAYMIYDTSALHGCYDEKKKTDIYAWYKVLEVFKDESKRFNSGVKARFCCVCLEHLKKMKKSDYDDQEWYFLILKEARKCLKWLLISSFPLLRKISATMYCLCPNVYGKIHSIIR